MPLVSVIIPNYNHSRYLKQRIDSVLNQTFYDFEIIILDDFSTDGSKKVIDQYRDDKRISHIIYNTVNSGSTFKQWKKGIDLAKGELIWIAESDDVAEVDFLEKMTIPFFSTPSIGLVFCQSYQYTEHNEVTGTWLYHTKDIKDYDWNSDFYDKGTEFISKSMFMKNPIVNASAMMFRKSLITGVGFLDTNMTLNGDWLFYIKCLMISDVYFISRPLNFFRYHLNKGSSSNINNFNNVKEYYIILNFLFENIKVTERIKKKVKNEAFTLWYYYQGKRKMSLLLEKQFFTIIRRAMAVDKLILIKFVKAILKG